MLSLDFSETDRWLSTFRVTREFILDLSCLIALTSRHHASLCLCRILPTSSPRRMLRRSWALWLRWRRDSSRYLCPAALLRPISNDPGFNTAVSFTREGVLFVMFGGMHADRGLLVPVSLPEKGYKFVYFKLSFTFSPLFTVTGRRNHPSGLCAPNARTKTRNHPPRPDLW